MKTATISSIFFTLASASALRCQTVYNGLNLGYMTCPEGITQCSQTAYTTAWGYREYQQGCDELRNTQGFIKGCASFENSGGDGCIDKTLRDSGSPWFENTFICSPGSFEQTTEAALMAALGGITTPCIPAQDLSPTGNGTIALQAVSASRGSAGHYLSGGGQECDFDRIESRNGCKKAAKAFGRDFDTNDCNHEFCVGGCNTNTNTADGTFSFNPDVGYRGSGRDEIRQICRKPSGGEDRKAGKKSGYYQSGGGRECDFDRIESRNDCQEAAGTYGRDFVTNDCNYEWCVGGCNAVKGENFFQFNPDVGYRGSGRDEVRQLCRKRN